MKKHLPFLVFFVFFISLNSFSQTCVIPTGGTINGVATGCTDKVEKYSITDVTNATTSTSYTWVIAGATNYSPDGAADGTSYNILFGSGNVTITITPKNGTCSGAPITKTITVAARPNKPVITQTGTSLSTTIAPIYQWYKDSAPITGATGQTYTPTGSGLYVVEFRNAGGCNSFSDPFNFLVTAIKEDTHFNNFSFYPNPVVTSLHTKFTEKYNLEFFDLSGKKVLAKTNLTGEQEIDLSFLNKGMYIMRIISDGKKATRKILVN